MADAHVTEVDPFDLPDWLGEGEVGWLAQSSVRGAQHVAGVLTGGPEPVPCDLLAADVAYPRPVLDPEGRRSAHQQWVYGQVLLVEYGGRLTLTVPGTAFTADLLLEALARLAKAVGVKPSSFTASLRL